MSRGGQKKDRSDGAERKCIVTGEVQPKSGLIRFVIGPDNTVVPDVLGKLPGRGIYVSSTKSALELAGRGQFARSAKQQVEVPDGLAQTVEQLLTRRVTCVCCFRHLMDRSVAKPSFGRRKGPDISGA